MGSRRARADLRAVEVVELTGEQVTRKKLGVRKQVRVRYWLQIGGSRATDGDEFRREKG